MSKIFSIILLLSILSFIVTENEDTNDIDIETSESIDEGEQFFNTMDDNEEDYENPLESLNYTNILYYDDSNYTSLLNQTEPTYILFYINWDNMCNNFMPIFIETANYCKEKNIAVNFVRIDSNISPNASNEFEVSDYLSVCQVSQSPSLSLQASSVASPTRLHAISSNVPQLLPSLSERFLCDEVSGCTQRQ